MFNFADHDKPKNQEGQSTGVAFVVQEDEMPDEIVMDGITITFNNKKPSSAPKITLVDNRKGPITGPLRRIERGSGMPFYAQSVFVKVVGSTKAQEAASNAPENPAPISVNAQDGKGTFASSGASTLGTFSTQGQSLTIEVDEADEEVQLSALLDAMRMK